MKKKRKVMITIKEFSIISKFRKELAKTKMISVSFKEEIASKTIKQLGE
jgi:hypothetical protein